MLLFFSTKEYLHQSLPSLVELPFSRIFLAFFSGQNLDARQRNFAKASYSPTQPNEYILLVAETGNRLHTKFGLTIGKRRILDQYSHGGIFLERQFVGLLGRNSSLVKRCSETVYCAKVPIWVDSLAGLDNTWRLFHRLSIEDQSPYSV